MSIRKSLIASLLLIAATSYGVAEDAPASPPEEPQWTEFQSPEKGFAITFPGKPKTASAPVEGQNPLIQYDFSVPVGDNTVYTVVVFEYPAGKAPNPPDPDYYAKVLSAYAKGSETKIRKKGAATIAERQGFEAYVDDNKGKLSHLIDIVPGGKDRVYMVISAGPKGHAGSDDAERFRDSFRLIGEQPVSGTPPATPTTP